MADPISVPSSLPLILPVECKNSGGGSTDDSVDECEVPMTAPVHRLVSHGLGISIQQTPDGEDVLKVESDFISKEPPHKSLRLTCAVLNYVRPDGLNLVPLGSSVSVDLFARLNNGMRRGLIDLYNIIEAMRRGVQDLRTSKLKLFFRWWDIFASFLSVSFDAYQQVLLPWVSRKEPLPETVAVSATDAVGKSIDSVLNTFKTIHSHMMRRAPDETIARIIKALNGIHPLVKYFFEIENNLPDLVERQYSRKETENIEKGLITFVHKQGSPLHRRMHVLVLARGMTIEEHAAWKHTLPFFVRVSMRAHSSKFKTNFVSVFQKLASM